MCAVQQGIEVVNEFSVQLVKSWRGFHNKFHNNFHWCAKS